MFMSFLDNLFKSIIGIGDEIYRNYAVPFLIICAVVFLIIIWKVIT